MSISYWSFQVFLFCQTTTYKSHFLRCSWYWSVFLFLWSNELFIFVNYVKLKLGLCYLYNVFVWFWLLGCDYFCILSVKIETLLRIRLLEVNHIMCYIFMFWGNIDSYELSSGVTYSLVLFVGYEFSIFVTAGVELKFVLCLTLECDTYLLDSIDLVCRIWIYQVLLWDGEYCYEMENRECWFRYWIYSGCFFLTCIDACHSKRYRSQAAGEMCKVWEFNYRPLVGGDCVCVSGKKNETVEREQLQRARTNWGICKFS